MAQADTRREKFRQKYHSDPAKYRAISSKWAKDNPEKVKEMCASRYLANREVAIMKVANYRKTPEGRANVNSRNRARAATKSRATPAWSDKSAIDAIYLTAIRVEEASGVKVNVDHYYPIKGKSVCGLHVPGNLRIITADENNVKRNRHPDDWEEEKSRLGLVYPSLDKYLTETT